MPLMMWKEQDLKTLKSSDKMTFFSNIQNVTYADGGDIPEVPADELKGVVLYHEDKGNFLVPKDTFYIWIYDDEKAVEKLNSGEWDYIFFPHMGKGAMFSPNYIPPLLIVWNKPFAKKYKGSDKLIGIAHGWIRQDENKLYIEMMTVRKDKRRQGYNSRMMRILRNYFKVPKENVIFNEPTKDGKLFEQSGKYNDGGEIKNTKMKLSLLSEVKNKVSNQYIAACAEMCGHTNVTGHEAEKIRAQMIKILDEYGDTEYSGESLKKLCSDATKIWLGTANISYAKKAPIMRAENGGGIPLFDYKYEVGQILTDNDENHEKRSKPFKGKRTYYIVVKQVTDWKLNKNRTDKIYYPAYWVDAHLDSPSGNGLGSYKVAEDEVETYVPSQAEIDNLIKSYERRIEIGKSLGRMFGGLDETYSTLIAILAKYKPSNLANSNLKYKDENVLGKNATKLIRAAGENGYANNIERYDNHHVFITMPKDVQQVKELYDIINYTVGVHNIKPVL